MKPFLVRLVLLNSALILFSRSAFPLGWDQISLNVYGDVQFERQLSDQGNGDKFGSIDSNLVGLVFNFRPTSKVRLVTDLVFEHGPRTRDAYGSVGVDFAYAEYTVRDYLRIRAGKFYTPFGIFNEFHTAKTAFLSVKEAQSTGRAAFVSGFRAYPRNEEGVGASGDFSVDSVGFRYDFIVSNGNTGTGIISSNTDTTNPFSSDKLVSKAVTGRLVANPIQGLSVGPSFYYNPSPSAGLVSLKSWGLLAQFDHKDWIVWTEVVRSTMEKPTSETTELGWYVQVGRSFETWNLTPYFRYEHLDPKLGSPNDDGSIAILGANWQIDPGLDLKVEDDYFHGTDYAARLSGLPGNGYHELKVALAFGF